jgi:hypothetical protein
MLVYTLPDNRQIQQGQAFELDGIKYPRNWLTRATPEDLQDRGITVEEIADPEPEPYQPTVDDVIAERARRLALGFDYDFGDERGVHRIGTTDNDMKGWDEVTKISNAFLAIGENDATIQIETNTGPTQVTALEWQYILIAAAQFRQPIWLASFALQKMDPIPEDYADDSYWLPSE